MWKTSTLSDIFQFDAFALRQTGFGGTQHQADLPYSLKLC